MEQIKLSTINHLATLQGKASKKDPGMNLGEQFFDVLLEQKTEQYMNEAAPETAKKSESAEEPTEPRDVETTEKPAAEQGEEEETCDVAREAAAAQIVWIVDPNAAQIQTPEQQEEIVTLDGVLNMEMSAEVSDEAAMPLVDTLTVENEEKADPMQELIATDPVITETVQETVQETAVVETEVNGQGESDVNMEIEVTVSETDETGGEAVAETPLFEGVETAPIKVAEAPERTEETADVQQQVVQKLSDLLENGETKLQIQLEPVELGKLTIELTRSADGTLNILLDAENLQTRSLLEKSIGTLQETLIDRGQKVAQITVEHNEEAQRQDNQQRDDLLNQGNGQQKQQREQHRDDQRGGADFLQQLRLGLIPLEEEK
ncbi:MAG: flagellar hook-length control protein FliK [Oscillospiraceae bacterium]|nr:flagellar hook-length control protein FliK [Oscillospiraceae bacterium]